MPPKASSSSTAKAKQKAAAKAPPDATKKTSLTAPALAKAKAGAAPPAQKEAAAEPVEDKEGQDKIESNPVKLYQGKPLDVPVAWTLLDKLSVEDMASLAASSDPVEQLPARMLLEYVGDKDHSWANTKKSLEDGNAFKKEIAGMDGADFVTKKSLERYDALGELVPKNLENMRVAAFVMAVFMEAIIDAAKEKLDMKPRVIVEPEPDEEPPEWPIKVGIKDVPGALQDALKWKRTPIFVCNGNAHVVDAFFTYQATTLIDAKWILNQVDVKKEQDIPTMKESLRSRLVSALKWGQPIQVAMSNSAVKIRERYCDDDYFPEGLFSQKRWFDKEVYSKVIRGDDKKDWPGAFPGRMRDDCASYVFVTTDFGLETAREYLPDVLPYFDELAVIEVDPDTIDSKGSKD